MKNKEIEIKSSWFDDFDLVKDLFGNLYPKQLSSDMKSVFMPNFIKMLSEDNNLDDKWRDTWLKYLQSNRKSFYKDILKNKDFLNIMIREKFLNLEDTKELIKLSAEKSLVEVSALLLDYQNNNFTEDEVIDSTIKELSVDPTSASYLRKFWNFKTLGDGKVSISNYKGKELNVIVPSFIGKNKVTEIGDCAFAPHHVSAEKKEIREKISSIIISEGVTKINAGAFEDCISLSTVTLPETVTEIEYEAFSGCSSLTTINIPNSIDKINYGIFRKCKKLSNIIISDNITSIEMKAFQDCSSLSSITIPNSVTYIGDSAFENCRNLTSITLGNGINEITSGLFRNCNNLTSFVIPESVTKIESNAFSCCRNLSNIIIPEGVTTINHGAFHQCNNLKNIFIPASVIDIWSDIFWGCKNITIQGKAGSYAEEYAKKEKIKFEAI